jgi:hypothetical protein
MTNKKQTMKDYGNIISSHYKQYEIKIHYLIRQ